MSYDHLRVFGCECFVYVPKDKRSKLDVMWKPYIFVGYGHDEFGYRCYDPIAKKLICGRDIIFVEDQTIKDIDKVKKFNSSINHHLIGKDPTPMIREVTQGDIAQEQEYDEDINTK
jgi:hypothetical protein